jgi:alpha-galactosidase
MFLGRLFSCLASKWRVAVLVLAVWQLGLGTLQGQTEHNATKQVWSLKSGPVEYRLQQDGGGATLRLAGKAGGPQLSIPSSYDISGLVEGQGLLPGDLPASNHARLPENSGDLILISHETRPSRPQEGCTELRLLYKHRRLPLEIEALYTAWGDTGVFTRQLTLRNSGVRVLRMESAPSLAWRLPPGEYTVDYLYSSWGMERQLASEKIGFGRRALVNTTGRSTAAYSPWFSLRNEAAGVRYAAQLAYSGNWEMFFDRSYDDLRVELGMRFDFGGAALLQPGASFRLPAVAFTASTGDLDDIANQLHRYQRRYVIARTPANDPNLITQFNSWEPPVRRAPTAAAVKNYADIAAELGLEAVVIDSGWFSNRGSRPDPIFGDWEADPATFPKGLRDVADYVHAKGMKFGVWLEIETAGTESRVFREHPDWFLRYNGAPMLRGRLPNAYLNFAKPEVRRWARAVIDRLVREDKIDYWRLDYNIDVGERFDPPGTERSGTVLYDHLNSFLAFLDEIRAAYPNLFLENCASGGLRFDLAILARTNTTWVSDTVDPRKSVQLAYGCTLEFLPEACYHWMTGDDDDGAVNLSDPPGWWDFMFRIAMNGQFGISSRMLDWSPELRKRAAENIALYKRLRPVIAGADVYHLTPPPAVGKDPVGWMALQYTHEDRKRSILMVYRLGKSEARQVFRLRGLEPGWNYKVTEVDRMRSSVFTGKQLLTEGLAVNLDDEWRSSVIELQAVEN